MQTNRRLTKHRKPVSYRAALSSSAALFVLCGQSHAQAQDSNDTADSSPVDEIVVTARRFEEPIREVPFGVSALNTEQISRRNIDDQRAFGRSIPGFNLVDTGLRGSAVPNIRGVGSFLALSSDDASVPLFIDGVPVPQRAQDREFFDITQIEVLRGPQNVLFGRNAQAGAIGVTTADPAFEEIFEVGGEVGNLGAYRTTGLINVPISSKVAIRVAAQYDTRDGDIPDINRDTDVRSSDILNIHSKLLWEVDELTQVKLAVRYGNYNEEPTIGAFTGNPDFPQLALDRDPRYDFETLGAGLTVNREIGRLTLTSVTGYQGYTFDFDYDDSDALAASALLGLPASTPFLNDPDADFREQTDESWQFSQELRLSGELDNGIQLVGGLSYFRSELDFDILLNSTLALLNAQFNNSFQTDSYGIYGEATAPITDRLRFIGGLRYTREERDFTGNFADLTGFGPVATASETGERGFDLITGRAALSFDVTPTLTTFASVSRGAKAGGFELLDVDVARGGQTSTFDEALTWAYEIGARGTFLDDMVYVSSSLFFNDTKDENLNVFNAVTFLNEIENADTETYGFELETTINLTDDLSLSGGLGLLETEITRSDDPSIAAGAEVPFSPMISYNVALSYARDVMLLSTTGEAYGRVDYQFVGERTIDPQNRLDLESYGIVNISAGWDTERFAIYAFAENLLAENFVETALFLGPGADGVPVALGVPAQPRRYGVGVRVRF